MRIKEGVRLTNLSPQMVLGAIIVKSVYQDFGVECVVTSGNDSKHGGGSLHHCVVGKYTDGVCRAIDFRTKQEQLNGREQALRDEVKARLGPDFDVVLEAVGTENEHLHVEYDPK